MKIKIINVYVDRMPNNGIFVNSKDGENWIPTFDVEKCYTLLERQCNKPLQDVIGSTTKENPNSDILYVYNICDNETRDPIAIFGDDKEFSIDCKQSGLEICPQRFGAAIETSEPKFYEYLSTAMTNLFNRHGINGNFTIYEEKDKNRVVFTLNSKNGGLKDIDEDSFSYLDK